MGINILFGHFPKYCCAHNTCQKRVSVISTFPQPAQVVRWSLDFLSPYSLLLVPTRFSSCNFWKASHAPCTGKLTAKCPLCSTRSPSFSRQPQHFFHLNTTPAETMTSWLKVQYLSERMQFTVLNGVTSDLLPATAGIPQGSVLGRFFHSIYQE